MKKTLTTTCRVLLMAAIALFATQTYAQIDTDEEIYIDDYNYTETDEYIEAGETRDKPDKPANAPRKVFFGGNFGMYFGSVSRIEVNPQVGYRLTPYTMAGVSATYIYFNNKVSKPPYSTSIYGGSLFLRQVLVGPVFAHAEIESLNVEVYDRYPVIGREWITGVLVGGGYRQQLGPNAYSNLMILWNINETINSPYTNPIFRIGIEF